MVREGDISGLGMTGTSQDEEGKLTGVNWKKRRKKEEKEKEKEKEKKLTRFSGKPSGRKVILS